MPVCTARRVLSFFIAPRTGCRLGLAAAIVVLGCEGLQTAVADGDTRTISLHHVHTNEDLTVTYKRNGRYDDEALKKINWILRDWRRNEDVAQDPRLIDLVWEVQREVGAKQAVHIICGYRAPQTNAMLRRKTNGVAQFSQHTLGKAMDFFIPGASLEELRNIGLRLQRGGIGFYPTSGSPFVHLDVGSVRHWPSISREELVRIFPNGRTVHVPSDGHPLPGYALAKADIERRGNQPSNISLAAARNSGALNSNNQQVANLNPLTKLFGFGKADRHEEEAVETTAAVTPASKPAPVAAKTPTTREKPVQVAAALPPKATQAPSLTADKVNWPGQPSPAPTLPEGALAYAPAPGPELNTRPASPSRAVESRPLPPVTTLAALPVPTKPAAAPAFIPRQTSIAVRQPDGKPAVVHSRRTQNGETFDDPWLRAAILAPNFTNYMTIGVMGGGSDYRSLAVFMQKPQWSVATAFSENPNPGLLANRFSGQAVVFVAAKIFDTRSAALQ